MSLRLYTVCALSVTASAVAGLLVGGFLAQGERSDEAVTVPVVRTEPVRNSPLLP